MFPKQVSPKPSIALKAMPKFKTFKMCENFIENEKILS